MTEPRDELLERYADAVAQDPHRPDDRVRNAARAHAQMLRDQAAAVQRIEGNAPIAKPAANQSQWTLSLVASLAVVGLAGLIYVQIDRGSPDVREEGLGAAAPSSVAKPAVATEPAPAKAAAVAIVQKETAPRTATVTPPVQVAVQPAESEATEPSDRKKADAFASAAPPREARAQDFAQSADRMAPVAKLAAPAPAPAAANMAPAPLALTPQRARQLEAISPTVLYLEAARTGNTETLQKLLAQGVAINARDDAGNTALMLAVRHRYAPVVRALLALGADTRLTNQEGLTALQIANQLDLADMAQLLQDPR